MSETTETITSGDIGSYVGSLSKVEIERPNGDVEQIEEGEDFQIVDVQNPEEADDNVVVIENEAGDHFHLSESKFVDAIGEVFELKSEEPQSEEVPEIQEEIEDRVESSFDAELVDVEKEGNVTRVDVVIEGKSTADHVAKDLRDFVVEKGERVRVYDNSTGLSSAVYTGRADLMDISESKLDTDEGFEQAIEEQKEQQRQEEEESGDVKQEAVEPDHSLLEDLVEAGMDEIIELAERQGETDDDYLMTFDTALDEVQPSSDDVLQACQDSSMISKVVDDQFEDGRGLDNRRMGDTSSNLANAILETIASNLYPDLMDSAVEQSSNVKKDGFQIVPVE